jgi:formate hydrogenlyase subunit 3/multisubunit Na+/H+ antiporter MnhD subunit
MLRCGLAAAIRFHGFESGMISDELFVCLILTAPLYASFTTMLFPVARPAIFATGLFLLGGSVFIYPHSSSIFFGSWLGSTVEESVSILLEFRVDRLSAPGIGVAAICLLAAPLLTEFASGRNEDAIPERHIESAPRLMTTAALCGLACTATDLSVICVSWLLLDVTLACRFQAQASGPSAPTSNSNSVRPLSPIHVSSFLLIVAALLISARYGTLRIDDLTYFHHKPDVPVVPKGFLEAASLFDRAVDAQSVRTGVCVLLALAVGCRAAVFPWLLWRNRASGQTRPLDRIVVPLAMLIPAGTLLLRVFPLLNHDEQIRLLILSMIPVGVVAERVLPWLVAIPLRVTSKAAELFDRHLMGGSREGAWVAHCRRAAAHVEHLRGLDPRYAALAAVLCVAGLLLALTGTGE